MNDETKNKELKIFFDATQSLKLYRRAELSEDRTGQPLIEELYVDPLPNTHVFNTLLKPHTSFLIGRKGTGKSTVFQRVQHEIRKSDTSTSVYLDIKTIFESSQVDEDALKSLSGVALSLSGDQIRRLFLFRAFLTSVVQELKAELKRRAEATFWNRMKESFSQSLDEIFEGLWSYPGLVDTKYARIMTTTKE